MVTIICFKEILYVPYNMLLNSSNTTQINDIQPVILAVQLSQNKRNTHYEIRNLI